MTNTDASIITVPPRLDGTPNQPAIDLLNRIAATTREIRRLAEQIKTKMDETLAELHEGHRLHESTRLQSASTDFDAAVAVREALVNVAVEAHIDEPLVRLAMTTSLRRYDFGPEQAS